MVGCFLLSGEVFCPGVGCVDDPTVCYETPPRVDCDEDFEFSSQSQVFQSTDYTANGRYPDDSTCIYRLTTSDDQLLKIQVCSCYVMYMNAT